MEEEVPDRESKLLRNELVFSNDLWTSLEVQNMK